MISRSKFSNLGTKDSVELGKSLVESRDNKEGFLEAAGYKEAAANFKEDNTMDNSSDMYTTVLAKAIWYKSYNKFQQYYDGAIELTPNDIGMPDGAGAYQLPKVHGSTAVKLSSGQAVPYINNEKDSVTLETESYGIGTRINRRIRKRAAKGFIDRLMEAGSDAVQRHVASDIANGMVTTADDSNTVSGGVSYDAIEDAKYNIKLQTNPAGVKFGFYPDTLALSTKGMNVLAKDTAFKNVFYRQQVPGEKALTDYIVWQGLRVMEYDLISVQKDSSDVHALVFDSKHFFYFLRETTMETFDGRIPGTAGDEEIIMALDAGMVAANSEAGGVITA